MCPQGTPWRWRPQGTPPWRPSGSAAVQLAARQQHVSQQPASHRRRRRRAAAPATAANAARRACSPITPSGHERLARAQERRRAAPAAGCGVPFQRRPSGAGGYFHGYHRPLGCRPGAPAKRAPQIFVLQLTLGAPGLPRGADRCCWPWAWLRNANAHPGRQFHPMLACCAVLRLKRPPSRVLLTPRPPTARHSPSSMSCALASIQARPSVARPARRSSVRVQVRCIVLPEHHTPHRNAAGPCRPGGAAAPTLPAPQTLP